MRDILGMVRFVLGCDCASDEQAEAIAGHARLLDVDILAHICHRYALTEREVHQKAARYCDIAFAPVLPRTLKIEKRLERIGDLGSLRSLHARLYDREIVFAVLTGPEMLALGRSTAQKMRARVCVVPPHAFRTGMIACHSGDLVDRARQRLARRWPAASAGLEVTRMVRIAFAALLSALVVAAALTPFAFEPVLVPLMLVLFLPPAWFRLSALLDKPDREPADPLLPDAALPVYSVLVPLRDEAGMVRQIATALKALDYPPEKLDIKFLVEQTSTRTAHAVRQILDDPRFELIIVPESAPHTKPKALDYGLPMVRGMHVVIYDAEDIPEPDQLRKAASRFAAHPEIDCLQAELTVDNIEESWLTRLFAAEYSGLFGVMLPALDRWRLPMPLGGTSNHFRVRALREVGGWDAFNVTEDADLGVRLSRLRYRAGTLSSRTFEEAPVTLAAWMRQRTRWMKGWMQTFIVHNRHPRKFLRDMGWRNFLAFQLHVGSMIYSAPLHATFVVLLMAEVLITGHIVLPPHNSWRFTHVLILVAGYLGAASHAIAGAARLKRKPLVAWQIALPLYWTLIGIAAGRAAYELVVRPHFWAKTTHGRTRMRRHRAATAPAHQARAGFRTAVQIPPSPPPDQPAAAAGGPYDAAASFDPPRS